MAKIPLPTIPAILSTSSKVGDLKLDDIVLSTLHYEDAFNQISSYIVSSFEQISSVGENLGYVTTSAENLCASVKGCQLSIDGLSTKIGNVYNELLELSAKAIFHYINNVSFLKPVSDHPLNLSIQIFNDNEMSVGGPGMWAKTFDSANPECTSYIEALLINNAENNLNTEQIEMTPGGNIINSSQGTQWMKPAAISGELGFGVEYNNAPVVVHLYDWLKNTDETSLCASYLNKESKLYLRIEWYYTTVSDGKTIYHKSDAYSQVVPSNSEQTADKTYFAKQEGVYTPTTTAAISYLPVDDWSTDDGFYTVKPGQVNILQNGLNASYCNIYLGNYSLGNEYKIKFTAKTSMTVDNDKDGNYIHIAANGATLDDFNSTSWSFTAGKTYLISIQAGMIQVLSQK